MNIPGTKSPLYALLNPIENYPELRKKEYPLYYDVSPVQENYFSFLGRYLFKKEIIIIIESRYRSYYHEIRFKQFEQKKI